MSQTECGGQKILWVQNKCFGANGKEKISLLLLKADLSSNIQNRKF